MPKAKSQQKGPPPRGVYSTPVSEEFTFFYGHGPFSALNTLSQHHPTSLIDPSNNTSFATSEHYMMYHKALLFEPSAAPAILEASTPALAKQLGRAVSNFDPVVWDAECDAIVERANFLKFKQNPEAWAQLKSTRGVVVEAAPRDRVWGIGFGAGNAHKNRDRWGQNRLGKVLTRVRERLLAEEGAGETIGAPSATDSGA